MRRLVSICIVLIWSTTAIAGEVSLGVASNFLSTAEKLAKAFEAETGHSVSLNQGATGLLFAQTGAGAPFDILLAADADRPAQLLEEGKAREVQTYAFGSLVLVSTKPVTRETAAESFAGQRVALADPILAPYGKAATSAMEQLGLDTATFSPLVVANAGQAATLFETGGADLAFVAGSSVPDLRPAFLLEDIGPTLRQDAALLTSNNPAAGAFWQWIFSDAAQAIISGSGYGLP